MFQINPAGLTATYTVAEIVDVVDMPRGEQITRCLGTLVLKNEAGHTVFTVGNIVYDFEDVMFDADDVEANRVVIPLSIEPRIPAELALR